MLRIIFPIVADNVGIVVFSCAVTKSSFRCVSIPATLFTLLWHCLCFIGKYNQSINQVQSAAGAG